MVVARDARLATIVLGVTIALGGLFAAGHVAPSASADTRAGSAGACTSKTGVTVVVNFGRLGGGTEVRCAPGAQTDGFAALQNAGFDINRALRAPGFVCRINAKPKPADDPCVNPSPADAYWSYWHGENRGWVYSDQGAGLHTPPPGSIEGWAFTGEQRMTPSPKPPATGAVATATTTKPRTPATQPPVSQPRVTRSASGATTPPNGSSTTPSSTIPAANPSGGSSTTSTSTPTTTTTAKTAKTAKTATTSKPAAQSAAVSDGSADGSGSGGSGAGGESKRIDVMGASERRMLGIDDGPPLSTLGGVAVVAGLAATASVVQRRRRRLSAIPDD